MRHRNRKGCGCFQERQSRWLEPTILFLLWNGWKHGYELMSEIPKFGFVAGPADPGAIYRTLRHLENVGLVTSEWDTSGTGAAKRIYKLSQEGKNHLRLWADSLRNRRDALNSFLTHLDHLFPDIDRA
ncbi:helix-turn-helix transcriptional regulator [candidate division KSB1 bacterium]|nr:helix-turn-helix transcriptional regulator [candidate division KSB1 bacterium]